MRVQVEHAGVGSLHAPARRKGAQIAGAVSRFMSVRAGASGNCCGRVVVEIASEAVVVGRCCRRMTGEETSGLIGNGAMKQREATAVGEEGGRWSSPSRSGEHW